MRIGPLLLWLVAGFFAYWGMGLLLGSFLAARYIVVLPFVLNLLLWIGLDVVAGGIRRNRWLIAVIPSMLLVYLTDHFGTIAYILGCAPRHSCL